MAQETKIRTASQPKPATHNGRAGTEARSTGAAVARTRRRSGAGLWILLAIILALAGAAFYYYFYYLPKSGQTAMPAGSPSGGESVRVVTANATRGDIGVYLTGLGAVTSLYTDTIQSRVSGQLMKVLFTEGEMVKAGDQLVQIDDRPYRAQLAQYVAQKEHDQALLDNANIDLQRYQTLAKQNSIAEQTVATQVALVKEDQGTVDVDQAMIEATQLNIDYCDITAPISGRVGLRLVDPGNYVQSTSSSGLLVIVQVQPITVIFTIAEDHVPEVMAKINAGQTLTVEAYDRGGFTKKLAAGTLLTTDNLIDSATGTLKLRAVFDNEDNALFPNQFVNIKMLVDTKKSVILVPLAAVQHGNQGSFVYVVDPDSNTVSMKNVAVGTVALDGSQAEITSGISEGDMVVTDGVDKLQDGAKVIVTQPGATGGSSSTNTPPSGTGNGG
jgi:multidrug efflux system membrane fusion protein